MKKFDELQLSFEIEELDDAQMEAEERAISYAEARLISEAARNRFSESASQRSDAPLWFKDYLGLIEKGWPWRVACYIAWASSPRIGRLPKTLEELATGTLGLGSARQIFKWRKRYPTIDSVVAMMQAAPLWEHRNDIFKALAAVASEEDYKSFNDRKLALEMMGDYVPRSVVVDGGKAKGDETEMTDDELRKWLGDKEDSPQRPPVQEPGHGGERGEEQDRELGIADEELGENDGG